MATKKAAKSTAKKSKKKITKKPNPSRGHNDVKVTVIRGPRMKKGKKKA